MEIIVIGGGAAGLFCAGFMAEKHKVTIIEHMDSCGKKLLVTGKGRCNVTNDSDEEQSLRISAQTLNLCSPLFISILLQRLWNFSKAGECLSKQNAADVFSL